MVPNDTSDRAPIRTVSAACASVGAKATAQAALTHETRISRRSRPLPSPPWRAVEEQRSATASASSLRSNDQRQRARVGAGDGRLQTRSVHLDEEARSLRA